MSDFDTAPDFAALVTPADPSARTGAAALSVAELRDIESSAAAGQAPHTQMARAGQAAAHWLARHIDHDARTVWCAAGPGNNGGDALVAATELHRLGLAVEVCLPVEPAADDARWALAEARAVGVPITTAVPDSFEHHGWLVDGLFGIGLSRPLAGPWADIVARINAHARVAGRVLALDVPSGLDSDSGLRVGGNDAPAVEATHTLSFIAAKPGLYMNEGRDLAGRIEIETLGLPAPAQAARINAPALFAAHLPRRAHATHKGSYGSIAIIGGATGMCGAPILAARAALLSGAGKVYVGLVGEGAPAYDALHPELMLHPADTLSLSEPTAIAIGCGLGTEARAAECLATVLKTEVPLLIDADALNLIAATPSFAAAVQKRGARGEPAILTPHPLEAARLLDSDTAGVQRDRIAAARALAARYSAVIVLKGAGTVIASPDGRLAINSTGNAALATGGTGDVLGGMIGALLAQHVPHFEAALTGVWLHGLAAEALCAAGHGPSGLAAGELAGMARQITNRQLLAPRA